MIIANSIGFARSTKFWSTKMELARLMRIVIKVVGNVIPVGEIPGHAKGLVIADLDARTYLERI
jgi:hypothetical protein